MSAFLAFLKKEILCVKRSGKLMLLLILFVLFGIMNPAIAKLTPWLLEAMSEALAESGMTVTSVSVSAMDSWVQFFKNIPMALIAFVLLMGGIFTREYQSGTLILSLTKGLNRYKVVAAKTAMLVVLWSVGYWLCFGITYGYNAYFWSNAVARNLMLSVCCWWVFGLFVISLMVLFSTLSGSSTGVLAGTGGTVLAAYLLSILPAVNEYLPTFLTDGNSLIYGTQEARAYTLPLLITGALTLACFAAAFPIFNQKKL